MNYFLSATQAKALLIRGTPLRIALPTPNRDEYQTDLPAIGWIGWARKALGREHGPYVRSAVRQLVAVIPSRADGLTGILGQLLPDGPPEDSDSLVWWIDAVVCDLDPSHPRASRLPLQWPGKARSEAGEVWPKPADKVVDRSAISTG